MKMSRIVFALCLLWQSTTLAQATPSEAARAEASTRFRRGVELYQEDAFRAALVEFERAYEIAPDYRLLYNIAQTKYRLQDYLAAAQSYEAYLAQGGTGVTPERRAQVEEALHALRDRVGRIGISVNRDGADVYVDDQKVGVSPIPQAVLANVGRHRVLVRAADGSSDTKVIDVPGADVVDVRLTLTAAVAAAPVVAAPAAVAEKPPLSAQKKGAIAGWAAGGALLVGGLVTGIMTNQASDELDKMLATADVDQDEAEDQRDSAETLAITTDVLIGVGAAAVVAGTLLWVLDKPDQRKTQTAKATRGDVRVQLGLSSLFVRGSF